ncbi:hypothetical protein LguiA_011372 [Lonicera macranthoides]
MDEDVPCSSIAVESIIRIGTAGLIWGACAAPYDANRKGLIGLARASFVAVSIHATESSRADSLNFGSNLLLLTLYVGLFAGIFSYTRCGLQRYRRQNDWMNALVAGAVAGAVIGAGSRNWKQVAGMAGIISTFCAVADYSKPV